jgi:hypothetical protein
MPYKDPNIRKQKAKEYTAAYRARVASKKATEPKEPRFCGHCGVSIVGMRLNAKFCSRQHKGMFSDAQRDYAAEYAANQEHLRKQALSYYHKDVATSRAKQLARQKNNLPKFAAYEAKRRAVKMQRTPSWLTEDNHWMMEQTYEFAALRTKMFGFAWHVDHIVPLQGKLVSGLHVPWNLQVIPATENISKNNNFEVA